MTGGGHPTAGVPAGPAGRRRPPVAGSGGYHWRPCPSPRTTSPTSTSIRSSACSTASAGSPSWSTRRPQQGMDSLAITDHGALYGAVAFYQAAKNKGIKPIIGVETYVARRSMTDKEGKADSQPFHLILLAKDWTGLPEPVPADHRRPHRRLLLQAADRPRAPGQAQRGADRPVRVPRRRDPQGARDRRLGAGPQPRRGVRRHLRARTGSSWSSRITDCRSSAGSTSNSSASRPRPACRSW